MNVAELLVNNAKQKKLTSALISHLSWDVKFTPSKLNIAKKKKKISTLRREDIHSM